MSHEAIEYSANLSDSVRRAGHTRRAHVPGLIVGSLLIAFPIVIQIPYGVLIATFDYPDILREPAGAVLERYAAGGTALTWAWYGYAVSILPLLACMPMLPAVIPRSMRSHLLTAAVPLGVASALLQMIGLLRWVVLVPLLADAWRASAADPATRTAIALIFQAQHQLLGVLMGEHLGQILLSLWTAGSAFSIRGTGWLVRSQRWLGLTAALLFLAGSTGSLGSVFPALRSMDPAATLAFLIWSVWCCVLGVLVIRAAGQSGYAGS